MWRTRSIINTLGSQPYLRFYEIMHYPVPNNAELYFQYSDISDKKKIWISNNDFTNDENLNKFSRTKKYKQMDEYLTEIKRLETIFKSIPFVNQIFLCNSITFNALDENSDIDLFIIAEPWRIWSVKFWSMLLFSIKWAKRRKNNIRKKICLSFFITSDQQNLYPISLPSLDVYLCYRISHLVLIYTSNNTNKSDFFIQNKWIKGILPNYQQKQTISLWIEPFTWNTKFKTLMGKLWKWILGSIFEFIVRIIQKLIIHTKILINPEKNKDVIINDGMLKFHQDIREKISLMYNIKVK